MASPGVSGSRLVVLALVGVFAAVLVMSGPALAQTNVPDAPTAVAAYSIRTENLEVRWSSSDSSVTSFKVQWKSGSEEFDSSRQVSSDPATSIVDEQSTSAGNRYKETISGLADGTEYTVRVIAVNSNGDSDPSGEVTGTPQSTPREARKFIENEVIEIFESSHSWLRTTWDYITAQNPSITTTSSAGGSIGVRCSPNRPEESNLRKCDVSHIFYGHRAVGPIRVITHELAHVYTLSNGLTSTPGPLGVAHLYFYSLGLRGPSNSCSPIELYAEALTYLVHGPPSVGNSYFTLCPGITDSLIDEAVAVARSVASGDIPSWFATTFDDSNGDPDLERVWALASTFPGSTSRAAVVFQLRGSFGGYCDNRMATDSAFGSGDARNPWSDGGCVPEAPASVAATGVGSGKLSVSWQEPSDDGGSPIQGYKVQWKSGTQEYSSSRQAVVTSPTDPWRTISGLTNDESHTLRVLAYNQHGDGAEAGTTATPAATDTTAPVLLAARVDGRMLRLMWNEAIDHTSHPETTAYTVNVDGAFRGTIRTAISGRTVTLTLTRAVSAGDSLTVAYSAPTDPTARRLRDRAHNAVADLSAQTVRNDTTQVAITSDPGTDMTYIWGNGFGGEDMIEATVTFSENVVVSGVPQLTLLVGDEMRHAAYRTGSGASSLIFRYILTEGDTDTDGVSVPAGAVSMAAGLVRYASTNSPVPAQVELAVQSAHLVDAAPPVLVSADAVANRNDVTLTWDEALDEGSVPTPRGAGFSVQDTGDDTSSRQISTISVLDRVVTLTLSSTVSATDQLSVSYTVPLRTHPPLKDSLGNYASSDRRSEGAVVSITQRPNSPAEFPSGEDGARGVDENTPAGRNVGTPVAARDADNDGLTYSISGADAASFDVVASSGQLRTKGALNHEGKSSYSFTMSVHDRRDVHNNSDTTIDDTISVTVTVDDVDEPADISCSASSGVTSSGDALAVEENHDSALTTCIASDPENKAGLTYTWSTGGRDRARFAITSDGVMSFVDTPDYERPEDAGSNNVYDTGVDVRDSDGRVGGILFTVTVDAVDEPPEITGDAAVSVEEGGVLRVGAYRAKDPENATIAWRPLAGDDSDKFKFTASNGGLAFKSEPDYEVAADAGGDNVYDVTLGVSAGGHTATFDIAVTVTNKDEAGSLRFSSPRPQAAADYTATLSDFDSVVSTTWTWQRSTSRSGPWTAVSGATGGATSSVYRPVADDVGYYLRVAAAYTDGHGPNKSRVLVSANTVGAARPTNTAPSFSDRAPTRRVAENARTRAAVGAPVRATDTDSGDVVTYELSGSDLFTIDSRNGQIRVAADDSLDHETAPTHSVTVTASDTSNASDSVTVTIDVTNINEPPDAVADTATASEDGDITIDVLANDSDPEDQRSDLTIRVTRNPRRGRATVNEPVNTGDNPTITYTPNADYNGADIFTYEVRDTASPPLSSTATVSVDVNAVNDAPVFRTSTTSRSVSENAGPDDKVGAPVTATDVDGDTLTYRLFGTDAGFFDIGARSGQITVADAVTFDRETQDTYTVTVDASDGNGGTASTDITVTVTVSGPGPGGGGGPDASGGPDGGGDPGGGGPVPAVQVRGDAFGAVGTNAEFTVAAVELGEFRSVGWAVAGPDGFTAAGDAERLAFAPPAGGAYRVTVTVVTLGRETFTDSATLRVFGDITDHRFVAEILWLAGSGITVGCSSEPLEYCPGRPVTRAQMASFLSRALDLQAPDEPAGFDDIDPSGAHAPSIEALYAAEITVGCSSEPLEYCPGRPVTRAQMASFLSRALDLQAPSEPAGFDDIDPSGAHAPSIEALYAAEITVGCSSEPLEYCPGRPVTRAQMAAFLHRARHRIAAARTS